MIIFPGAALAAEAADPPDPSTSSEPRTALTLQSDGSLLGHSPFPPLFSARLKPPAGTTTWTINLGLPAHPPETRWQETDGSPILHTQWLTNGIRLTQTVFATRLTNASPGTKTPPLSIPLLIVHVLGENLTNVYTEATAALSLELNGQPVDLLLNSGLVHHVVDSEKVAFAALDIPAEGVADLEGKVLRFRGDMPPGTSGSMTLKIPLQPVERMEDWHALQDLEFDIELRRTKQEHSNPNPLDPTYAPLMRFGL